MCARQSALVTHCRDRLERVVLQKTSLCHQYALACARRPVRSTHFGWLISARGHSQRTERAQTRTGLVATRRLENDNHVVHANAFEHGACAARKINTNQTKQKEHMHTSTVSELSVMKKAKVVYNPRWARNHSPPRPPPWRAPPRSPRRPGPRRGCPCGPHSSRHEADVREGAQLLVVVSDSHGVNPDRFILALLRTTGKRGTRRTRVLTNHGTRWAWWVRCTRAGSHPPTRRGGRT